MKRIVSFTLIVICLATPSFADQVVRATWYGNELRGHRTASGETFNPGGMTAAHKSTPLRYLPCDWQSKDGAQGCGTRE